MKTAVDYYIKRVSFVEAFMAAWREYHFGAYPLEVSLLANDVSVLIAYIKWLENRQVPE